MATYIQGLTDTIPDIQAFQPDFNLVQKALSTRQNNYDKGFAAVDSAYNRVINTPLTNTENANLRTQFVKDAQNQLKDLPQIDLSQNENVAQAENVFAPLWEDQMIIKDAALTKYANSEIAKGTRFKDSKDDKERDAYSDTAMKYIQNGLDELRDAGRNPDAFRNLEKRSYLPWKNVQKYLNETAASQKLEVQWDTPNGPTIISKSGGKEAVPQFETWARGMMGSAFDDQFRITGIVEKEERVKNTMRTHGVGKQQALALIANDVVNEMDVNYTKGITRYDDLYKEHEQKIALIEGKKQGDLKDDKDLKDAVAELAQINAQRNGLQKEYKEFQSRRDTERDGIVESPDWYFSRLARERTISSWANGYAANQKYEIKTNPGFTNMTDQNYKVAQIENERSKLKIEQEKNDIERLKIAAKYPDADGDGIPDGSKSGRGGSKEANANPTYLGADGTNVQKQNVMDSMRSKMLYLQQSANDHLLHHNGLGQVLSKKLGLSSTDVQTYLGDVRAMAQDPNYKSQDNDVRTRVNIALFKATKIDPAAGPIATRNAIVALGQKYFQDKGKDRTDWDKDDERMAFDYAKGMQSVAQSAHVQKQMDQLVNLVSARDPQKYEKLFTGEAGNRRMKGVEDIAGDFRTLQVRNPETNQYYSHTELAQMYLDGSLKLHPGVYSSGTNTYGGTAGGYVGSQTSSYVPSSIEINGKQYPSNTQSDPLINNIITKNGRSEDFVKLKEDLNSDVQKYSSVYGGQSGIMGHVVGYNMTTGDKVNTNTQTLVKELSLPSNRNFIFKKDGIVDDAGEVDAITQLLATGDKKYIENVEVHTIGRNGKPTFVINLKPADKDNETNFAGKDYGKLLESTGGRIEIEASPNAQGNQIKSIPVNSGRYVYSNLLSEKLEADEFLKAAGFDFSIIPDPSRRGTSFVTVKHKVKNPTTGDDEEKVPLNGVAIDFNEKSPDEAMDMVFQMFDKHMFVNQQNAYTYKQTQPNKVNLTEKLKEYKALYGLN